jgi:tetratricopeptide (TPR) repeat protein
MFNKIATLILCLIVMSSDGRTQDLVPPHEVCRIAIEKGNYQNALSICSQLRPLILAEKNPVNEVHYYFSMINLHHGLENETEVAAYLKKVENHPSFNSEVPVQYQYYRTKGRHVKRKGDYESTIAYYTQGLQLALKQKKLTWLSQSYHNLGIVQRQSNNYEAALINYTKSLEVLSQLGDLYMIANTQRNIGVVYTHLEEHQKAINFYEQAYASFIKLSQAEVVDTRVNDIIEHMYEDFALAYYEVGDSENSHKYKQLILEHYKEIDNLRDQTRALMNVAILDLYNDMYSVAITRLMHALKLAGSNNFEHSSEMYFLLAKAYQAVEQTNNSITDSTTNPIPNQINSAINSAEQGLILESEIKNHEVKIKLHQLLSQLYLSSNKDVAIEHMQKYQIDRELFFQNKFDHSVKTEQHKLELMLKDKNLVDEKYSNLVKSSEITILQQSILMFVLLLLGAVGAFFFLLFKRKKERQQLLSQIKSHQQQQLLLNEQKATKDEDHRQIFKKLLVETMNLLVETWEKHTGSNRVELAEKSGAWTITIDNGTLRTRSLDKYMSLNSMPKFPRWKNVIKTCHFILSDETLSLDDRASVNEKLDAVMQVIKQRSLS